MSNPPLRIVPDLPSTLFAEIHSAQIDSIEPEEGVISFLLQSPTGIEDILKVLKPEDFEVKHFGLIYRHLAAMHGGNISLEISALRVVMEAAGDLNKVPAGIATLRSLGGGGLYSFGMTPATALKLALQVVERARRRVILEIARAMAIATQDPSIPLVDLCSMAEGYLSKVSLQDVEATEVPMALACEQAIAKIEADVALAQAGLSTGIPTGLIDVDRITGGLHQGDLVVVAARPSMGKTAYLWRIAHEIATNESPVLIFSMEMSARQIALRALTSESGVGATTIRDGKVPAESLNSLRSAAGKLAALPVLFDEETNCPPERIRSAALRYKAANNGQIGAVMIDYLQLMPIEGAGFNENVGTGKITRALKNLARELNCPVILLSQLSRTVESRNDKRPMMSDLRNSGSIEQDADQVIMLYRDEYYNPDTPDKGVAEILIRKNRNGPTGTAKVVFDGERTQFNNLIRGF
jgi:replicative DNA helicase